MLRPLRGVKRLIRSWLSPRKQKTSVRKPLGARLCLEPLENRLAPANLSDSGIAADAAAVVSTSITLSAAVNGSPVATVTYGTWVTFTAVVSSTSTPTGSVQFLDQTTGVTLGNGNFISSGPGSATYTYTTLPTQLKVTGTTPDDIQAIFTPMGNFVGSTGDLAGGEAVTPAPLTISGMTVNDKIYDGTNVATLNWPEHPWVSLEGGLVGVPSLVGIIPGDTITLNNAPAATLSSASGLIAFDAADNMYVTGSGTDITRFAAGSTTPSHLTNNYPGEVPAMATDAAGDLFVATYSDNSAITEFAPGSTVPTAILSGLSGPDALAFDSAGNLYVANTGTSTISKFTPGSTTPSATLTGLNYPVALVFDPAGNLYVANYRDNSISKFAPGSVTPTARLTGVQFSQGLLSGTLGTDSAGDLYAIDSNFDSLAPSMVSKFSPGSTTPSATLIGLFAPSAMAVDAGGNVYVSEFQENTVLKFAAGSTTPTAVLTGLNGPTALALDSGGNLYVATAYGISKFTADALSSLAVKGVFASKDSGTAIAVTVPGLQLVGPQAGNYTLTAPTLTANITPQQLTVTGVTANNKVYDSTTAATINASGAALNGVLSGDSVTLSTAGATGAFQTKKAGNNSVRVSGLTLSGPQASDYSLVKPLLPATITPAPLTVSGMTANNKVYDGSAAASIDVSGATLGVFSGDQVLFSVLPSAILTGINNPNHIAVDAGGNVYVSESSTVAKFAPGSTTPSALLTGVSSAGALAIDPSGNLYVSNYSSGTVSEFAPGSTIPTATISWLGAPRAMGFDSSGNLYALNANHSVSRFAPGSTVPNMILTTWADIFDMAVDGAGNIYVAGFRAGTIYEFAVGSSTRTTIVTGLHQTYAMAADAAGNLYVDEPWSFGMLLEFTAGSTSPRTIFLQGGVSNSGLLAVDTAGNLYAGNFNARSPSTGGVERYDSNTLTTTTAVGTFASKNIGHDIPVTVTGLAITGADAGNYTLTWPTLTASIMPAPLTVTGITANNKVYDGTTKATLNTSQAALSGLIPGDVVTLDTSAATGTFATSNIGNGIIVNISGLKLDGLQAADCPLRRPTLRCPLPWWVISPASKARADSRLLPSLSVCQERRGSRPPTMSSPPTNRLFRAGPIRTTYPSSPGSLLPMRSAPLPSLQVKCGKRSLSTSSPVLFLCWRAQRPSPSVSPIRRIPRWLWRRVLVRSFLKQPTQHQLAAHQRDRHCALHRRVATGERHRSISPLWTSFLRRWAMRKGSDSVRAGSRVRTRNSSLTQSRYVATDSMTKESCAAMQRLQTKR
jgi:sugar lactone lactonase YvrE